MVTVISRIFSKICDSWRGIRQTTTLQDSKFTAKLKINLKNRKFHHSNKKTIQIKVFCQLFSKKVGGLQRQVLGATAVCEISFFTVSKP